MMLSFFKSAMYHKTKLLLEKELSLYWPLFDRRFSFTTLLCMSHKDTQNVHLIKTNIKDTRIENRENMTEKNSSHVKPSNVN